MIEGSRSKVLFAYFKDHYEIERPLLTECQNFVSAAQNLLQRADCQINEILNIRKYDF